MHEDTRKVFAVIIGAAAALMGYVTLTIPAIAATAPAVLTIALAFVAWVMWPKRRGEAS